MREPSPPRSAAVGNLGPDERLLLRTLTAVKNGEITAESDGVGKGATFTVTLPVIAQHLLFGEGPEAISGALA